MRKKYISIFIIVMLTVMLLASCNSLKETYYGSSSLGGDLFSEEQDSAEGNNESGETSAERKIIYKINTTIYADDLAKATKNIRLALKSDEWLDYESVSNTFARFVARVKSDRVDEFIKDISNDNEVRHYEKSARDVSVNYYDNEAHITALEAEQARLVALYLDASIEDMIIINKRLSQIELEINNLQSTLNQYDSLIEYSEVSIYLYEASSAPVKVGFGARLNELFKNAWKALGSFFGGIIIFLTAAFPFIVVLGPITAAIVFLVMHLKKRKKDNSK